VSVRAIMLPNWIGDAVLAAPAVRLLTRADGGARAVLVAHPRVAPLYGRWPCLSLLVSGRGIGGMARVARRLRRGGVEEAILLSPSMRSALVPYVAGIRARVGYASDGRGVLLTRALPVSPREVHLAKQYLALAAGLAGSSDHSRGRARAIDSDEDLDPALPIGDDEIDEAARRLSALGFEGNRTIALCPGATYGETKRWPLKHWVRLGKILQAGGRQIVIVGGGDESRAGQTLALEIGRETRSLAGEMSLRQSLALLRLVAGAVSNDSGAMHLATAAGCPVVGLFGSTNPEWTGPLGRRSAALSLGLPCSPWGGRKCPTEIECLRDLQPEMVARRLALHLASPAAEGGRS